jgi:hypothetical protein
VKTSLCDSVGFGRKKNKVMDPAGTGTKMIVLAKASSNIPENENSNIDIWTLWV